MQANPKISIDIYGRHFMERGVYSKKSKGRFWLVIHEEERIKKLIEIIERQDNWYFKSNEKCKFVKADDEKKTVQINKMYTIRYMQELLLLHVYEFHQQQYLFQLWRIEEKAFLIGRGQKCQICYNQAFVSHHHALLEKEGGTWKVKDLQSKNGVYVNRKRIQHQQLKIGDVIDILRLRIVVLPKGFLINELDSITLSVCFLTVKTLSSNPILRKYDKRFILHPNVIPRFSKEKFVLYPPPPIVLKDELPFLFILGPSLTMGFSTCIMGLFTVMQSFAMKQNLLQSAPTLMMSVSMALGTILWPLLTKRYEKKKNIKKEILRQDLYRKHLQDLTNRIQKEMHTYSRYLDSLYLDMERCLLSIQTNYEFTWVRNGQHKNFLTCSIGKASRKYKVCFEEIKTEIFSQEDVLETQYRSFYHKIWKHEQIVALELLKTRYVSVLGTYADVEFFIMWCVLQILSTHHPDTLKVVIFMNDNSIRKYRIGFLPHVFYHANSKRLLIHDFADTIVLQKSIHQIMKDENMYCLFVNLLDETFREYCEPFMKNKKGAYIEYCKNENYQGVHNQLSINVEKNVLSISSKEETITCKYQKLSMDEFQNSMRILANLQFLFHKQKTYDRNFLDIYRSGNVHSLWKKIHSEDVDISRSLKVVIGVNEDNTPIYLDAHEYGDGPHGVVAGMTGSGKSEFLQNYILALALHFSSRDVNFFLIDYKGAGMATAFEKLKHVCGIMSNIDEGSITRCTYALQNELKQRQEILLEAKNKYKMKSVDINDYYLLCKKNKNLKPLAHLFIIADEFAELKLQQPEFLTLLNRSARIGRSLGIHLILATQKPSGVIDDQIWSNVRFHICLKVQSESDSYDMLKKGDAAHLKHQGEFFIQIGSDEFFEKGFSLYHKTPYVHGEIYEEKKLEEMHIMNHVGNIVETLAVEKKSGEQILFDALLVQIDKMSELNKESRTYLWRSPLRNEITYHELLLNYPKKTALLGVCDDVVHQRQSAFCWPLVDIHNTCIFAQDMADALRFIEILLYSYAQNYDSEDCIFYLFDFSMQKLRCFKGKVLIGDIIFPHESEKMESYFYEMREEIKIRKSRHEKKPHIISIILDFEALKAIYPDCEDQFLSLLRDAQGVYMHWLFATRSVHSIALKLQTLIFQNFVFQLKDRQEYSLIYTKVDVALLEEHCAMFWIGNIVYIRFCQVDTTHATLMKGTHEKKYELKILPEHITHKIEDGMEGLFLGCESISKHDYYMNFNHIHYIFYQQGSVLGFVDFIKRQVQSKYQNAVFVNEKIYENGNELSLDDFYLRLKEREELWIVWEDFSLLETIDFGKHHHLILSKIKNFIPYVSYPFFEDHIDVHDLIWIGKGFSDYAYVLKRHTNGDLECESNQAFIWKENQCLKIQIWEEEESG